MARTADIKVTLTDGVVARVSVEAPEGVADAPGTPFGVTYEPAPVVALVDDGLAEDAARGLASLGRSVATVSCEARELEGPDVAEAMSALGVTQAHLLAEGAGTRAARSLAERGPHRTLSVACREEGEDASAFMRRAARAMDEAEPSRRHRPLVVFEDGAAHVAPRVEGVLVRPATLADEPAALAMYDHLLDSCDVPGRETCGWRRGFWPLPDDVSRRLREGTTWVAVDVGEGDPDARRESDVSGAAPAVLGAMSLDGDFGLPGAEPDWELLEPGEFLTCHLLATDPAARGHGVATALLAEYAREAIARGCKALRINTSPESLSNRLYHELGFTLHAPQWFPYEGLPITGWTNVYELRLDGPTEGGESAAPGAPREPAAATGGPSVRTLGDIRLLWRCRPAATPRARQRVAPSRWGGACRDALRRGGRWRHRGDAGAPGRLGRGDVVPHHDRPLRRGAPRARARARSAHACPRRPWHAGELWLPGGHALCGMPWPRALQAPFRRGPSRARGFGHGCPLGVGPCARISLHDHLGCGSAPVWLFRRHSSPRTRSCASAPARIAEIRNGASSCSAGG